MKEDSTFNDTGTAFAVVSPCSKCKNQLSAPSADGKPYCPRRYWQVAQTTYQKNSNGKSNTTFVPLALYGTEGTSNEGDQSLRNPVYDNTGKSSLVWIATLRDNSGIRDNKDKVVAPSILDPSFTPDFTNYIQCRSLPYIPAVHEAAYRQLGALKEGDTVLAITAQEQQNYSKAIVDGNTASAYQQVPIEGVVIKVDLAFKTPRAAVDIDHVIAGT